MGALPSQWMIKGGVYENQQQMFELVIFVRMGGRGVCFAPDLE